MTNANNRETCDACMGFGQLETGCDTEGLTNCHHCGGWGSIETEETPENDDDHSLDEVLNNMVSED